MYEQYAVKFFWSDGCTLSVCYESSSAEHAFHWLRGWAHHQVELCSFAEDWEWHLMMLPGRVKSTALLSEDVVAFHSACTVLLSNMLIIWITRFTPLSSVTAVSPKSSSSPGMPTPLPSLLCRLACSSSIDSSVNSLFTSRALESTWMALYSLIVLMCR